MTHTIAGPLLVSLLTSTSLFAQVETFASADPRPASSAKPTPQPFSVELGLDLSGLPALSLPSVDLFQLAQQDAQAESAGDVRYRDGVVRALALREQDGVWHALGEGRWLWTAEVRAEGALRLRLHFANLNLPRDAQVIAYAPHVPLEVAGPYAGAGPFGTREVWTPSMEANRARIEYRVEGLASGLAPTLPFDVDALVHTYREAALEAQPEGVCVVDSSCDPALDVVRRAVGRMSFVSGFSNYLCTGTLLQTVAGDLSPYFATASGCISTADEAASVEIHWLYQTSTCNGTPPSLSSVPRSNYATLLATDTGPNLSLLMVEGVVPSGVAWAGWSSTSVGSSVLGNTIHHSSGLFKQVSSGLTQPGLTCQTVEHFRASFVSGGMTVGGAGAGYFRTPSNQFSGTMTCGPVVCGVAFDFGQFADAYPGMATLFAAGSDDPSEPNDTCGGWPDIAPGVYTNRIVKFNDPDWYELSVPAGGLLTIDLAFSHARGDIDAELWVNCGDLTFTVNSVSVDDHEHLQWLNTGGANTVAWKVFLADDVRAQYNMFVSLTPENDDCGDAAPIGPGAYNGTTVNATNSNTGSCDGVGTARDVWYRIDAVQSGVAQISISGAGFDPVLTAYNECGQAALTCNNDAPAGAPVGGGSQGAYLAVPVGLGEDYYVRVSGLSGSSGWFVLRLDIDAGAPFCLGDGFSALDCPCANHSTPSNEAGCRNSTGSAGRLAAVGNSSVNVDTVVLQGSGMPPNSTGLYFQGTAKQGAGNGSLFGDGLRCAAGTVIRLGTKTNSASGDSSYPTAGDQDVSLRGLVPAFGGWRYYQVWYRNAASYCTASTFNLSNGYELFWRP